jgi:hypothetical protein
MKVQPAMGIQRREVDELVDAVEAEDIESIICWSRS